MTFIGKRLARSNIAANNIALLMTAEKRNGLSLTDLRKRRLVNQMLIYSFIFIISIIIVVLLSKINNIPPHINNETISTNQTIYGNVMYRFSSNGIIQTNQRINNMSVLFETYDPILNESNYFRLRIWNISKIMITNWRNGTQTIINYSMENEEMVAEGSSGYFMGLIKFGQLNINYTNLSALNRDGLFFVIPIYSFLKCDGELDHQSNYTQDFQLLSPILIHINNKTIEITDAYFSFPINQYARFELITKGRGQIKPTPTFIVNGTIWIDNFRETSMDGKLIKIIDHLNIKSPNIIISTIQEPYCDVIDDRWQYITPWSIKIQVTQF